MERKNSNAVGSQMKSIATFYPRYPSPESETLTSSNIHGSGNTKLWEALPPVMTPAGHNSMVVSAKFRTQGMRYLYSYSKRMRHWFKMIATGQTESSKFQTESDTQYNGSFNDQLYRVGGYPQNLGLTFKAPSVPDAIAQTAAWGRMRPRPQITASVFTRRAYGVAPSKPAQPINPPRQT